MKTKKFEQETLLEKFPNLIEHISLGHLEVVDVLDDQDFSYGKVARILNPSFQLDLSTVRTLRAGYFHGVCKIYHGCILLGFSSTLRYLVKYVDDMSS